MSERRLGFNVVVPFGPAKGREAEMPSPAVAAPESRVGLIEGLYRDHWKKLCARLCRVHGNGPPEPEDLAQTAFARLIEHPDAGELVNPAP